MRDACKHVIFMLRLNHKTAQSDASYKISTCTRIINRGGGGGVHSSNQAPRDVQSFNLWFELFLTCQLTTGLSNASHTLIMRLMLSSLGICIEKHSTPLNCLFFFPLYIRFFIYVFFFPLKAYSRRTWIDWFFLFMSIFNNKTQKLNRSEYLFVVEAPFENKKKHDWRE